ncbi:Crp/Fnr family transcriptional regulator [Niabella sp. CC-SYL272]|uniref:Crp/Fnr family transcriptional regulator n=1 Tax=Niabella agricola TaxID=2891571 RepID=UPI001F35AD1B|nr:Crp/Fnr family transcriptional regulator [Niabella agricola]MCF3108010.1 Crp/Fnr family transcriptional regulator [Niabella agricola]
MLRTNQSFLVYIQQLYEAQPRKEDIIQKTFARGKKLLTQHEKASRVMLIKEGIAKCFITEENDKDYIVEFLGKGEIIGEIEGIRGTPCLCSIEAITPVDVYALSLSYFSALIKKDLRLNNLLLEVFAQRIVYTSSRASYQQLYTIEHSLSRLLTLQKQQSIEISKEDMAAYLGVTIRSLNRALKTVHKNKNAF